MKKLKANKVMEGKPCGWCKAVLAFGEDAAACQACQGLHHADCWDRQGGCASKECANRPLERLESPEEKPLPAGKMRCPHCQTVIDASRAICPRCHGVTTPDGVYDGPKVNAPGAVASMWYGIVGILICGLILGIVAIVKSNEARRLIAGNANYGGAGYAQAGLILGIIDLVLWGAMLAQKVLAAIA